MLASKNLFQNSYSDIVLTHRSTAEIRERENGVPNSLLQ